jgi:hypothetical protein
MNSHGPANAKRGLVHGALQLGQTGYGLVGPTPLLAHLVGLLTQSMAQHRLGLVT